MGLCQLTEHAPASWGEDLCFAGLLHAVWLSGQMSWCCDQGCVCVEVCVCAHVCASVSCLRVSLCMTEYWGPTVTVYVAFVLRSQVLSSWVCVSSQVQYSRGRAKMGGVTWVGRVSTCVWPVACCHLWGRMGVSVTVASSLGYVLGVEGAQVLIEPCHLR